MCALNLPVPCVLPDPGLMLGTQLPRCGRRAPVRAAPVYVNCGPDEEVEEAVQRLRRFALLRELHQVRDFQLELRAGVWESSEARAVQLLKEAVAVEKARGGSMIFSLNRW